MFQRLAAVVGIVAAMVAGAFIVAAPASAAGTPNKSAVFQKKARTAAKKAAATCRKAKRARGRARVRAVRNCRRARNQAKRAVRVRNSYNAQFFDVCKNGCRYRTVQAGVNAAGAWQKRSKRKATVRIQPGTYVEGVLLVGKDPRFSFNGMTIMGVKKNSKQPATNARAVVLEGENATTLVKGTPGWQTGDAARIPAQNAIEASSTVGLKMMNMWARNYQNNTFFVWASNRSSDNEYCADYVMDNLVSSDTRSYGLFARNCFGGRMVNSEGWNHGDSALYVGETPCDDEAWVNRGNNPGPCQANPKWTLIDNFVSHQNVLGYSGTNSKYVKIQNSTFYNNGAGIVPNTLDSEKFEPSGWMILKNNDIFWNNYNYFSTGSEFQTVSNGLGELLGNTVNYPMGVGIALFGSDSIQVLDNNIFGNEKWGAMTFSAPVAGELVNANDDDDAKSLNNHFIGNQMGRGGLDPNGTDFLSDYTGGGNCWKDNSAGSTFVPGSGNVPLATIYPECADNPVKVLNKGTQSFNVFAGIQLELDGNGDPVMNPDTILGYAGAAPPETQECSWDIATPHAAFTDASGRTFVEKRADPVVCP
jgi:parallel beta-helix repeat protein